MSHSVGLVACREAAAYELSDTHPLTPTRFLLTLDLIEAYGLDRLPNVHRLDCRAATDDEIGFVHTAEFIEATKRAGHGEDGPWSRFGYGPGDNPIFSDMHEAGALVVGATLAAARGVMGGRSQHAFNPSGGLHHAMPDRAAGFCVYNDVAIAIAWLLRQGLERIAYVDVDVHHGDGVQEVFYSDPRVLTASIHQFDQWFFPGTGDRDETGVGDGVGTAVNVPLPGGIGDERWLEGLRGEILPRVREFRPQILVSQLGADTHATDPLATLQLTTLAYREAARDLHELAHDVCDGRWLATGGGGYSLTAVPRAWTIYFAEMCGTEVPDELPEGFVRISEQRLGRTVPTRLDDR
jgi:acetoin utilization protein AcuC